MDADTALRVMTMFSRPGNADLQDLLTPGSDGNNLWFSVDVDLPLAMSWHPGVPGRNRVTVDPDPITA